MGNQLIFCLHAKLSEHRHKRSREEVLCLEWIFLNACVWYLALRKIISCVIRIEWKIIHISMTVRICSTTVRTSINSFPVMAVNKQPLSGVYYLEGEISLKTGTKIVLLRHSASPFKGTCLFLYSIEVPFGLYGPYLQRYKPFPT